MVVVIYCVERAASHYNLQSTQDMLFACSTTIMGNNLENFTCLYSTLEICEHNYTCG